MQLNRGISNAKTRAPENEAAVVEAVRAIIDDVRSNGESAVRKYAQKFDGFSSGALLASPEEIKTAVEETCEDTIRILKRAAGQITEYHANQVEKSWFYHKEGNVVMGQLVRPLRRVALYVPGGTASYPSTVLMNAIPAKLAGVKEVAVFTPAGAGGEVAAPILAAAACCGIDKVYKIGGAQAIAAAAYGAGCIPKFDKIVGPGNIYVTAAKRLVSGDVDIDMAAGPSEVLIVADDSANPVYIAADMMSQAEHDRLSRAILITTSERIIEETEQELERQAAGLERADIIRESIAANGCAILAGSLSEAFALANEIAPEHLEILTRDPLGKLPMVENAGSIFLGEYTPEPLGDYMSGTNHVLPTGGAARYRSPLGVYDFIKRSAYSCYSKEALACFKDDVMRFAKLEGLDAHANSIQVRFDESR